MVDDGEALAVEMAALQREGEALPSVFGGWKTAAYRPDRTRLHRTGGGAADRRRDRVEILLFGPAPGRGSHVYVTSGLSDPWRDLGAPKDGASGLGYELALEVVAPADWAADVVAAAAAYALLIGDGIVAAASRRLDPGSRVSVGNPIDGGHGVLRHLVCAAPIGFDAGFSLDSGRVDIVQLVGVTEAEMEFAKLQGTEALLDALTARRLFVADNDRPSLTFKDFNANRGDSNA